MAARRFSLLVTLATIVALAVATGNAQTVPRDVRKSIQERAEREWPGDHEMQLHTIKQQTQAYRDLVRATSAAGVPRAVFKEIKRRAQAKWSDDYEMQLHTIKQQTQAYRDVVRTTPAAGVPRAVFKEIKRHAQAEWPDDYEMQLYTIKQQTQAYRDRERDRKRAAPKQATKAGPQRQRSRSRSPDRRAAPAGAAGKKRPVAWWRCDEGQNSVLADAAGNGNAGHIEGAKWVRIGSRFGLQFDGVDDRVDCGPGIGQHIREGISLLAWIWPEDLAERSEVGIVGEGIATYGITQYRRFAQPGDTNKLYAYISGGKNQVSASLPVRSWHHVASTFDGRMLRLYIDGREMAKSDLDAKVSSGGSFWIGYTPPYKASSKKRFFHGKITDVRVYNRALSDREVSAQYKAMRSRIVGASP